MNITLQHGYPDYVGKRQILCGSAIGPTSYSQTTGDPVALNRFQTYIDVLFPAYTVSKTYLVLFYPNTTGPRATWTAKWYTAAGMTEVSNLTNLSAEQLQVGGFGGDY